MKMKQSFGRAYGRTYGRILTFVSAILATHFVTAAPATAATFTQNFRDMPVRPGELCDDVAFAEGLRLTAHVQTHLGQSIQVIKAYCKPDRDNNTQPMWQIAIDYEGDQKLPEVSTINIGHFDHAGYKTSEECQANLEFEKTAYSKNTGLVPFLSYCRVPMFRDMSWELDIIGFGTPAKSPFDVAIELFNTVRGHTRDSFVAMVSDAFRAHGLDVVHVSLTNHFPYTVMSARYYGLTRINPQETQLVNLPDEKSCPAMVNEITSTLGRSDVTNYGVYCVQDTLTRANFGVAALLPADTNLKLTLPETTYEDSPACEASRLSVIDHYRNDLRRQVIGGYCTVDLHSKKFAVVLLEI
jgi:hypothetical protein